MVHAENTLGLVQNDAKKKSRVLSEQTAQTSYELRKWLPPEKIIGKNPIPAEAAPSAAEDVPQNTEAPRGRMIDMNKGISVLGEREFSA